MHGNAANQLAPVIVVIDVLKVRAQYAPRPKNVGFIELGPEQVDRARIGLNAIARQRTAKCSLDGFIMKFVGFVLLFRRAETLLPALQFPAHAATDPFRQILRPFALQTLEMDQHFIPAGNRGRYRQAGIEHDQ